MKNMLTLTNSFHGTSTRVRMTREEMEAAEEDSCMRHTNDPRYAAARRKIRRVWKKLCGIDSCTCGNMWGER